MTEKEKQILLKDLCARLPHGVCVRHQDSIVDENGEETGEFIYSDGYLCNINTCDEQTTSMIIMSGEDEGYEHHNFLEETKPYLRTMSSMTEDEKEELRSELGADIRDEDNGRHTETYGYVMVYHSFKNESWYIPFEAIDWLNAHHFDYRGLISMNLALEASEGMYNN